MGLRRKDRERREQRGRIRDRRALWAATITSALLTVYALTTSLTLKLDPTGEHSWMRESTEGGQPITAENAEIGIAAGLLLAGTTVLLAVQLMRRPPE